MTDHPSIEQQIEAVEWAAYLLKAVPYLSGTKLGKDKDYPRWLDEAAETLKTLKFGAEIAR